MKAETKVTKKYQTTIPKEVRELLDITPGKEVSWHIAKSIVIVDVKKKIEKPVEFLTSQIKLNLDAVKLVREAREKFA